MGRRSECPKRPLCKVSTRAMRRAVTIAQRKYCSMPRTSYQLYNKTGLYLSSQPAVGWWRAKRLPILSRAEKLEGKWQLESWLAAIVHLVFVVGNFPCLQNGMVELPPLT